MEKNWILVYTVIFFQLYIQQLNCLDDDIFSDQPDKSAWVDPHDMLNYDPNSKTMKNPSKGEESSKTAVEKESDTKEPLEKTQTSTHKCPNFTQSEEMLKKELALCEKQRKKLNDQGVANKQHVDVSIFMKQYVSRLLGYVMFEIPQGQSQQMNLVVELSSQDMYVLESYANEGKDNIQDVSAVLNSMIQEVTARESNDMLINKFERATGIDSLTLLQISTSIFLLVFGVYILVNLRLSLLHLGFNILILLFVVSVPWNWWHLYKRELAKRHAQVLKDIPAECSPKTLSVSNSAISFLKYYLSFSEDECTKYYEQVMVDPMWEVAPTKALAVTITKFFVEPLEHIGGAISKFFKATLQDLPVYMWPVVLLSLLVVFTLVLVIMRGYKVRFLGPLLGIEPTYHPVQHIQAVQEVPVNQPQPAIQQPQMTHREIQQNIQNSIQQEVQKEIHRMTETRSAQQCLEAPPTLGPQYSKSMPGLMLLHPATTKSRGDHVDAPYPVEGAAEIAAADTKCNPSQENISCDSMFAVNSNEVSECNQESTDEIFEEKKEQNSCVHTKEDAHNNDIVEDRVQEIAKIEKNVSDYPNNADKEVKLADNGTDNKMIVSDDKNDECNHVEDIDINVSTLSLD